MSAATGPPLSVDPDIANRWHQVFPVLDQAQLALLGQYGRPCAYKAGEYLYREGDRHAPMVAILSGEVAIERNTVDGPQLMATVGPGMFTGEIGTIGGLARLASARAVTDSEALVVDEAALRTLVVVEAGLSETIMRAFILRRVTLLRDTHGGVILLGSRHSADTLRLREFFGRNAHPVAYFDVEQDSDIDSVLLRFHVTAADIPVIISPQGEVLRNPTNRQAADAIGLSPDRMCGKDYDVAVVGAGPAGLAAAVYAASEGLAVAVLDANAPGGQAGSSSKIENYFGFPTGISGQALAGRGLSQARKFGAEVAVPVQAVRLDCLGEHDAGRPRYAITLDNGDHIHARCIIIATGARYRKPGGLARLEAFEGCGVYYAASFMEASLCARQEVIVVGGGNSAGQAAVFLSNYAGQVHVMVRGEGLAASMSQYLVQRLQAARNVTIHTRTELVELIGDTALRRVRYRTGDGKVEERPVEHVFLFLGAEPNTAWLASHVALDDKGFVLTGPSLPADSWPETRAPTFYETSRPGIFAVGDVRSSSVKRVATAVGEGAAAVQSLHALLGL